MPQSLFQELSRSTRRRKIQSEDRLENAIRDLKWRTNQGRYDRSEARTIINDAKVGIKDHLTSIALRLADPTIDQSELDELKVEMEIGFVDAEALWNPDDDVKIGNYMDIIKSDIGERYQSAVVGLDSRTMLSQTYQEITDLGDKKRKEGIFIEDGSMPIIEKANDYIAKSLEQGSTPTQISQAFALADLAKQRQFVHSMLTYYDSDEAKLERKKWGAEANLKFEQAKRSITLSENYDESERLIRTLHESAAKGVADIEGVQAKYSVAQKKQLGESIKMSSQNINSWNNSGTKMTSFDKGFLEAFTFNATIYDQGVLSMDKKENALVAYKDDGGKFMHLLRAGDLDGIDGELETYIEKDDLQGVIEYFANDTESFPGSDKSLGQSRMEEISSGNDVETTAALSVLNSFLSNLIIIDSVLRQENVKIPTKLGILQKGWKDFDERFAPQDNKTAWDKYDEKHKQ